MNPTNNQRKSSIQEQNPSQKPHLESPKIYLSKDSEHEIYNSILIDPYLKHH